MKKILTIILGLLIALPANAQVFKVNQLISPSASTTAGCVQSSGITTSTLTITSCGGGSSGNSAFTIGSGVIYNATSTDLVGIGSTTPRSTLSVQGKAGTNPFTVASSTGSTLLTVLQSGNVGIKTSTIDASLTIGGIATGSQTDIFSFKNTSGTSLAGFRRNGGGQFQLYATAGPVAVDITDGLLYFNGVSIDWQNKALWTSGASQPSLSWGGRTMHDSSDYLSIDWQNHTLGNTGGNTTVNWDTEVLFDPNSGADSVRWGGRNLVGSNTYVSVDWENRILSDSGGGTRLQWGTTDGVVITAPGGVSQDTTLTLIGSDTPLYIYNKIAASDGMYHTYASYYGGNPVWQIESGQGGGTPVFQIDFNTGYIYLPNIPTSAGGPAGSIYSLAGVLRIN